MGNLRGTGEPLTLTDGVSIWPTELIRLVVVLLAGVGLVGGYWTVLRRDARSLEEARGLGRGRPVGDRFVDRVREVAASLASRMRRGGFLAWLWRARRTSASITYSERKDIRDFDAIWDEYRRLGRARNRVLRVVPQALGFLALAALLFTLLGWPARPYRGVVSAVVDRSVMVLTAISFAHVVFFAADASRLGRSLIRRLDAESQRRKREGRGWRPGDETANMHLIERRTESMRAFLLFPFVLFLLLLLSRNAYIDSWSWPWSLFVLGGVAFGHLILSIGSLQSAARRAQRDALMRLKGSRTQRGTITQAATTEIERVRDLRAGAFRPLWQSPVVQGALLPLGGLGGASLIEVLLKISGG